MDRIKEGLFRKLAEEQARGDIAPYDMQYIIAVVNYIDSEVENRMGDDISFEKLSEVMLQIAKEIYCCTTGIPEIDSIVEQRMSFLQNSQGYGNAEWAVGNTDELRTVPGIRTGYVIDYIASISKFGGEFKRIEEMYDLEIKASLEAKVPTN